MALPLSGIIRMSDIRNELGIPTQSPFSLNDARNGTYVPLNSCSPYLPPSTGEIRLSDWYGYDHSTPCEITVNLIVAQGGGGYIDLENQSTLTVYTITAADATGTGIVPTGSYIVSDFGLNVPCVSPLVPYVSPNSFSLFVPGSVQIDIGCN